MNRTKLIASAFALVVAGDMMAETRTDTLVVTPTPRMSCENCVKKIRQNVRFVKGTKNINPSLKDQTVTIVYDGQKATYDDYVAAFRKIGYQIRRSRD